MIKNFKAVEKTIFGRGGFDQLGEIIDAQRSNGDGFAVVIVDDYFEGTELATRAKTHIKDGDQFIFCDITSHEPTTQQVDQIRDNILKQGMPSAVVGIGGGSVIDICKAVSLMITNEGSSTLYQGLNLVKKPGVYSIGIPTIAGTGAEVSMTAVLTGPEKKLGLKCEWTVLNQVILDPDLVAEVPTNQWFYTGMDCFIHCIESESGIFNNAYSKAYGDQSLQLCREVFLGEDAGQTPENDEKLMVASLMGGLSLTYSEVGICHALSYGLSYVYEYRHGFANCIAFNHLGDYYTRGTDEFKEMVERHGVDLPQNLSREWTEEGIHSMSEVALRLEHMWHHAFGENWKDQVNLDWIKDLYRRM